MESLQITFLGTGTSQGVPVIGCDCNVCISKDPRDKRLRTSVLVESKLTKFVIDTGPDFRQQMLREKVNNLDAIVFTHEHKDHMAGLDDVRAYNYKSKKAMEVYGSLNVHKAIKRDFHYVFQEEKYPGVPDIKLNEINNSSFYIKEIKLVPIKVWHHMMQVNAFRINNFTYITDANRIDPEEFDKIRGSEVIVLNALRKEAHISHFTLNQAKQIIQELKPKVAYFTHLSHQMGKHLDVEPELPENIKLAYDGLKIVF